jgi:hypothetical protein
MAEQMHLTLSFLGSLDLHLEERLRSTLTDVRIGSFLVESGHPWCGPAWETGILTYSPCTNGFRITS